MHVPQTLCRWLTALLAPMLMGGLAPGGALAAEAGGNANVTARLFKLCDRPLPGGATLARPRRRPVVPRSLSLPRGLALPAGSTRKPLTRVSIAPRNSALAIAYVPPVSRPLLAPLPGARTTLGRPFFDEERGGLAVPYQGQVPRFRIDAHGNESTVLELQGSTTLPGRLTQSFKHHPLMASWEMERHPALGTMSLSLRCRRPADVVVAADPLHHQLLVIPQPRLAQVVDLAAAPGPVSLLAAAQLPSEGRHLYIPYQGSAPACRTAQVAPDLVYLDFPNARLAARAVQFFSPDYHPTVAHWLMSSLPDGGVRLAVALTQPGGAAVYQDRTNQRLVVELGEAPGRIGGIAIATVPAEWPGELRQPVLGRRTP